jgi:hypothetical protein
MYRRALKVLDADEKLSYVWAVLKKSFMRGPNMGGLITGLLGGGDKPKVSTAPIADVTEEKRKAKLSRTQLLATEGGLAGSELAPDQVQTRQTLLGN